MHGHGGTLLAWVALSPEEGLKTGQRRAEVGLNTLAAVDCTIRKPISGRQHVRV